MKMCQSCGMPFEKDPRGGGTNRDGTKSSDYCSFCYQKGKFTFEGNRKEFQEFCRNMLVKSGNSNLMAWWHTRRIRRLKRWREI